MTEAALGEQLVDGPFKLERRRAALEILTALREQASPRGIASIEMNALLVEQADDIRRDGSCLSCAEGPRLVVRRRHALPP